MYRDEDLEIINNNLSNLEKKAETIYLKNYEPTLDEINNVYEIVKNYVRKNNLIIYGGFAQNSLIKAQNEKDGFYGETDIADIEFYSPEPIKDMIKLCDILYEKKFKYVEGSEGVHPETYKIFVNFINYCDISYMSQNIYDNCPTIKIDGMRMCHPHFMIVDAFRVYTDPMTSYFRLTKTFTRFNKLIKYYPFNENTIYNKIEYKTTLSEKEYDNIYNFIKNELLQKMKLIVVGHHGFNRLISKSNIDKKFKIEEPFFQVISIDFDNERNNILKLLKQKFGNSIFYKKYNPFFSFLDKSVEFFYKNQLILRLYGNNERCTIYKQSEKTKIYHGAFQLQILYALINYNLAIIRQNNFNKNVYMTIITRLLLARDTFLNKHHMNILSDSPFEEFIINCIGKPINPLRQARLNKIEKKKKGKIITFRYNPTGKPGKIPNFNFKNSSGNIYK
jgi:hypothetical protein